MMKLKNVYSKIFFYINVFTFLLLHNVFSKMVLDLNISPCCLETGLPLLLNFTLNKHFKYVQKFWNYGDDILTKRLDMEVHQHVCISWSVGRGVRCGLAVEGRLQKECWTPLARNFWPLIPGCMCQSYHIRNYNCNNKVASRPSQTPVDM